MLVYRLYPPGLPQYFQARSGTGPGKWREEKLAGFKMSFHRKYGCEVRAIIEDNGTVIIESGPGNLSEDGLYFRFSCEEDSIYIANLQVPQNARYRGMGTCCIRWLQVAAREMGFGEIALESYPSAIGFWEKLGFVPAVQAEDF